MEKGLIPSSGVIDEIARAISDRQPERPFVVAIDGPDAAGKTTFADRLGESVAGFRPVVRVQADHFENPRDVRYRRGVASPEGYFEDSYDSEALEAKLLQPLRLRRSIVTKTYDWESDRTIESQPQSVPDDAAVIVDGCFLLRERFGHYFDLTVFLEADEQARLERAIPRQRSRLGSAEAVVERFRIRYFPGFELYLEREKPLGRADYVIDNSDFSHPIVKQRPGAAHGG